MARPPRIVGFDYRGLHAYFLTCCVHERRRVFLDATVVDIAARALFEQSARDGFEVLAYCFMPDHWHALVQAERDDADLRQFVERFKQHSGHAYSGARGSRLWQKGYFDCVLRDDDDLLTVAAYVVANPVRAGLCRSVLDYPYTGSERYPLHILAEAIQLSPRRWREWKTSRP